MTGYDAPPAAGGLPPGPPWSLDVIADLHADLNAGALDPEVADELRRRVEADADAAAMLRALDATVADLSRLPAASVPESVAARIDAALRAEASTRPTATAVLSDPATPPTGIESLGGAPLAPVVDLAAARRRRWMTAGAGLLAAAAAVVAIVSVRGVTGSETTGTPQADAPSASNQAQAPLALSENDLAAALGDTLSMNDFGPLGAPGRLDACLSAIQVDPAANQPLGAREVLLDGNPGVLLILPTGTTARFRLVVVSPECGPGQSAVMADTTVGR